MTTTLASTDAVTAMFKSPDISPEDFITMREFMTGGERVPTKVRQFWESILPKGCFGVVYGTSELGIISRYDRGLDTSRYSDNVVGKLIPNMHCKVIDLVSRKALGPNKAGEIMMMSSPRFTGYYGQPELTKKAFDENNWYKVGDIGYFDGKGYLFVYGRLSDAIIFDDRKVTLYLMICF